MKPSPGQAPKRLLESPEGEGEAARLLRKLPPPEAPEGARTRVWARVKEADRERRRPLWLPALRLSTVVALGIAGWLVWSWRPPVALPPVPVPVLALAAGEVERPSPSRVRTGPGSRALVRVGEVAVLLGEETEVEIARQAEIAIFRGRVAVAVADGAPVLLRSPEGSVSGSGLFAAVLVDSRRLERVEVAPEERALLERFGRGGKVEAPLRVEAPDGYVVGIDGAAVGRSPLVALLPPGSRALAARRGEGPPLTDEVTVEEGQETLYVFSESVFREPAPAPPEATAPVPEASPHRGKNKKAKPAPERAAPEPSPDAEHSPGALVPPSVDPSPRPSGAVTAADPDGEAYARAKELLAQGQPAEAAALFSQVARGSSSRAELSLYELGRVQLRHLRDPAAARAAFSSYLERYPGGLLLQEVELSLIESELALSDLGAAGASMDRFLQRHPGSERRGEVLLLRANLDRDRGDCASALERYRQLARGFGAIADDATYFAAACAQKLGRTEEARALLQESLRRFPAGRHAEDARGALSGQ